MYGDFQEFLTEASQALSSPVHVVPQMSSGHLVPDYGLFRNEDHLGWVELKAPDKDLDELRGHDLQQFERALEEFESFVLTNGWDWRYYLDGALVASATFEPTANRDPDEEISDDDVAALAALLERLFSRSATIVKTPEEATRLLAYRARAIKQAVIAEMHAPPPILAGLYEEFEGLVYKSGREYSRAEFADAYAQTVVFGLLLARLTTQSTLTLESGPSGVDDHAHPFLFRALSIMTDQSLGGHLRALLQEAVTTVNRVPASIFKPNGSDPLLYAYESFFSVYDAEERAARGVYYTPQHVVTYQVSGIEWLLQNAFGFEGLLDSSVRFLDPATGTGTYLLGLLERANKVAAAAGAPVDAELAGMVVERVRAFELMVGPYAVAHQRVAAFLQEAGVAGPPGRLPIYLVDTLAEALTGSLQSRFGPLGEEIAHEREAAEGVKTDEPILVVLGNPPYDRIKREQLGDHWLLERIQEMIARTPERDRRQIHPIYDFYVAFWRWALWLISERGELGGRGIVSYITNRSWILGRTFGGMRDLFTERCSALYVLDLGGDLRTSRVASQDQNVFDVGVGVAIVFAVVDTESEDPAEVYYQRVWGNRGAKETFLAAPFELEGFERVDRADSTAPLVPLGWGRLDESPRIEQVFGQHESGVQTSRDALVVGVHPDSVLTEDELGGTIGLWSQLAGEKRAAAFHTTRTHPNPPGGSPSRDKITRYAYRPLDYRFLYNDKDFLEWPRPGLQQAFRDENLALVTIERGFGVGPAAFPVAALPDLHVFRGFGGSRGVYPLYGERENLEGTQRRRRRRGADDAQLSALADQPLVPMLAPAIVEWGEQTLPEANPRNVFAYVAAVLGAPSYVLRFEERGLIAERPRVPFTRDPGLAAEAVELGLRLVEQWTLVATPRSDVRWAAGNTAASLGPADWDSATGVLRVAGRSLEGVTQQTWEFSVSGLRVLPRYLEDREDLQADSQSLGDLRSVVSAAREIAEMEESLNDLLDRIIESDLASFPD